MTAGGSWNQFKAIDGLANEIHVLVGSQRPPAADDEAADPITVINRLQMSAALGREFRDMVLRFIGKKDRAEIQLSAYDGEYKQESHEVTHVRIADHDSVQEVLGRLPDDGNAPTLAPDAEALRKLRFYAVQCQTPNGTPLTFISPMSRNKELTQRNAVVATFTGNRFEALEDTSLVFEPTFAAVAFEGYLFIFKQGAFERLFDQESQLVQIAQETLDEIAEHVPIANFDAFSADSLNQLNKLRKLRNIKLRGYVHDITIESVRASIEEFGADQIRVQIVTEGGVEKLAYDHGQPWALLELLEDRFVKSTMTGRHYAANSKRDLDAQ